MRPRRRCTPERRGSAAVADGRRRAPTAAADARRGGQPKADEAAEAGPEAQPRSAARRAFAALVGLAARRSSCSASCSSSWCCSPGCSASGCSATAASTRCARRTRPSAPAARRPPPPSVLRRRSSPTTTRPWTPTRRPPSSFMTEEFAAEYADDLREGRPPAAEQTPGAKVTADVQGSVGRAGGTGPRPGAALRRPDDREHGQPGPPGGPEPGRDGHGRATATWLVDDITSY